MTNKRFQTLVGWAPTGVQKDVIESKSKERVICAGRGGGKSMLCGAIVAKTFIDLWGEVRDGKRESLKIWIVAPSYDLARKVFTYSINFLRKLDKNIDNHLTERPSPQLKINENIWIQCKSADEPKSLLGERVDLLIVDEAAAISKNIWFDQLQATTASSSKEGKVLFISTPRGKNWFYDLYISAKEEGGAFHWTSLEGTEMSQETWDKFKSASPADFFQQNYEATFLEQASAVFRSVREANYACDLGEGPPYTIEEPRSGGRYVAGLDLAQIRDFTVLRIFDYFNHKEVYFDRFHKISYPLQIQRIEAVLRKYGAKVTVEINNIGLAVADELRARGIHVDDFKTSGSVSHDQDKKGTKERLINKLAVDIENKNIKIAPIEVSNDELEAYTHIITPAGHITYGAPEGGHDDCVMALALANWGLLGKQRQENAEIAEKMPHKRKTFQYF